MGPADLHLLPDKGPVGRLGFVAQFAFYRLHARFPNHQGEFAPVVLAHLAAQIGVLVAIFEGYEWAGRTGRRHRESILAYLGVCPFDDDAEAALMAWWTTEALLREPNAEVLQEQITAWLLRSKFDRPGDYRFDRLLRSARHAYETGY